MNFFTKIKTRLDIKDNKQLFFVLLTFSLTGITIAYGIRPLFFGFLGLDENTETWIKIAWWLILVMPCYYLFLLIYGFIFGQFDFFWNFAVKKRMDKIKRKGKNQ